MCRIFLAVLVVCVAIVVAAIFIEEPHIVAQGDLGFVQSLGLETADSREILEQFGAMKKKWQKEGEERAEVVTAPPTAADATGNSSIPSGLARATIKDSLFFGSGAMFDQIAAIYDITNRCMSLGLDQKWRAYMVDALWTRIDALRQESDTSADSKYLVVDLAAGTSDVGIHVVQQAQLRSKQAAVIGVDPSREMLRVGQGKIEELGLEKQIDLRVGDAQNLYEEDANQIESGSVDAVTMSFGIRNVPDRFKALREMHRVLKVNREINILEFNLPDGTLSPVFSRIARLFITHVIPAIGLLTTFGKGSAEYDYFQDSIAGFPHWRDFSKLLNAAGFEVQEVTHFAFGAVQYYRGRKAAES